MNSEDDGIDLCCPACVPRDANPVLGFEKTLEFQNMGLVIYRRLEKKVNVDQDKKGKKKSSAKTIIIHNTIDTDMTSEDYLRQMRTQNITCPRCRQIIELALQLLETVPARNKKTIMGICDHCKLKDPCLDCKETTKTFIELYSRKEKRKPVPKDDGKNRKEHRESWSILSIEDILLHQEYDKSECKIEISKLLHHPQKATKGQSLGSTKSLPHIEKDTMSDIYSATMLRKPLSDSKITSKKVTRVGFVPDDLNLSDVDKNFAKLTHSSKIELDKAQQMQREKYGQGGVSEIIEKDIISASRTPSFEKVNLDEIQSIPKKSKEYFDFTPKSKQTKTQQKDTSNKFIFYKDEAFKPDNTQQIQHKTSSELIKETKDMLENKNNEIKRKKLEDQLQKRQKQVKKSLTEQEEDPFITAEKKMKDYKKELGSDHLDFQNKNLIDEKLAGALLNRIEGEQYKIKDLHPALNQGILKPRLTAQTSGTETQEKKFKGHRGEVKIEPQKELELKKKQEMGSKSMKELVSKSAKQQEKNKIPQSENQKSLEPKSQKFKELDKTSAKQPETTKSIESKAQKLKELDKTSAKQPENKRMLESKSQKLKELDKSNAKQPTNKKISQLENRTIKDSSDKSPKQVDITKESKNKHMNKLDDKNIKQSENKKTQGREEKNTKESDKKSAQLLENKKTQASGNRHLKESEKNTTEKENIKPNDLTKSKGSEGKKQNQKDSIKNEKNVDKEIVDQKTKEEKKRAKEEKDTLRLKIEYEKEPKESEKKDKKNTERSLKQNQELLLSDMEKPKDLGGKKQNENVDAKHETGNKKGIPQSTKVDQQKDEGKNRAKGESDILKLKIEYEKNPKDVEWRDKKSPKSGKEKSLKQNQELLLSDMGKRKDLNENYKKKEIPQLTKAVNQKKEEENKRAKEEYDILKLKVQYEKNPKDLEWRDKRSPKSGKEKSLKRDQELLLGDLGSKNLFRAQNKSKLAMLQDGLGRKQTANTKASSKRDKLDMALLVKKIKIESQGNDDVKFQFKEGSAGPKYTYGGKTLRAFIETHQKDHTHIRDPLCPFCIHSELELMVSLRMRNISNKFIEGKKIIDSHLETGTDTHERKPLFFHTNYEIPIILEDKEEALSDTAELPKITPSLRKKRTSVTQDKDQNTGVMCYVLSDRSFIEKGWTVLPTEKVMRKVSYCCQFRCHEKMNVYRMRPAKPEFDWFKRNKDKQQMFYDSGERFVEYQDDGRCRWYYKNGRMALDYYDATEANAQQRFVIYSTGEPDERGRARPYTILATFDHLGNGVVFDHSGKIRLKYNQTEGVVLDRSIGPVSHWKWHTLNDPPMLQQVMIDTQMAHKDPEILEMGVQEPKRYCSENDEMLAIEFENFVKEKSKKMTQKFKPFQIRMKAMKVNEHFSLKVLDQANVYLIYRDGTTNVKLNIGMLLDHKEIIDTEAAEVGDVASSLERLPARTDSLAAMQNSIDYAKRFERILSEHNRRIRPPAVTISADKMYAGISRPIYPRHSSITTTRSSTTPTKSFKPSPNNVYYPTS